ncbi:MAG TPA: ADP-forming succinate--CoA ligase subunit beta, partial [Alphaproteobacteria bacterium]|nr:ADP-forming succinate--CoA ligase subunit beta [Alphaproteobacteria bacterium]
MNIHEYQAKALLKKYGVKVLDGHAALSVEDALKGARALPGPVWVVKAQIHAGGRGKGGGVKVVKSVEGVQKEAQRMLGMQLVTHQTGPEGQKVRRLYIEQGCDIARELYLSLLLDRATSRITIMASTEGGMDIEEVAAHHPEKIIRVAIDPATGIQPFHAREVAFGLGLEGEANKNAIKFVLALYRAFMDLDASIVEINPLVVTKAGELVALDAKMNFDDNALFRHPEVAELRDEAEEDPNEKLAKDNDLSYVRLEGNIGCMVNGAGLAMSTMDIIKLYGGQPANFLDVGGGADEKRVTAAFKIILSDPNVKGVLVNIFGGIMKCDIIAAGIIAAAKEVALRVPLVVRLEGTNVDLGKKILKESGLPIVSADNLADAAAKVVDAT